MSEFWNEKVTPVWNKICGILKPVYLFFVPESIPSSIHKYGVGVGALLVGIGGYVAINQTNNILTKVTNLEKKITIIEKQLKATKSLQDREITLSINNEAKNIVKKRPEFQDPDISKREIKETLLDLSSDTPKELVPYLPMEKIDELTESIYQIKQEEGDEKAIENAIRENLEINLP